jgi:hypothetical protein
MAPRAPVHVDLSSRRIAESVDPLRVFDAVFGGVRLALAVVESRDGLPGVGPDGQRTLALLGWHVQRHYPGGTCHVIPVSRNDSPRRRVLQVLRLLTGGPTVDPWARTSSITFVCQGMACYRLVLKILEQG